MSAVRTVMRVLFPILVLLSMAALFLPTGGEHSPLPDKVIHMIIFGGLAGNGVLAQFRREWLLSGLLAYAVISEVLQWLMPFGRTGDWRDAAADTAGIIVGFLVGHLVIRTVSSARDSVRRVRTG